MRNNLLMALALLVIVWGAAGTMDMGNVSYSGLTTDPTFTVIQVQAGSPIEAAGMQRGDVIRSIGGIAMEDVSARTERGRPSIGETRTFVVDRGGQEMSLDVQYASLPGTQSMVGYLATLIGLAFLGLGIWAYRKAPNASTRLLAWLGVAFGLAFVANPYFSSATIRVWVGAITTAVVFMGFAILLDFLIRAGKDDAYSEAPITSRMVYVPAGLVAAMLAGISIFQPAATSGLNRAVSAITGLFVVGYFGYAMVQVVRNYTQADEATRESRALGMMLFGVMLGLLPVTLTSLVGLVSPQTVIPTGQYWFLTLAAIPVTFALAAVRGSESAMVAAPAGAAPPMESAPPPVERAPAPVAPPPPAPEPEPMADVSTTPMAETPPPEDPMTRSVGGADSEPSTPDAPPEDDTSREGEQE